MVGRISALYMKTLLVVCLWSVCLVMVVIRRGCGCFWGRPRDFGRTTGLEVSGKGKVEVGILKPLTAHEAEQPPLTPDAKAPLTFACPLQTKLQGQPGRLVGIAEGTASPGAATETSHHINKQKKADTEGLSSPTARKTKSRIVSGGWKD
jgi:hypothetical protein